MAEIRDEVQDMPQVVEAEVYVPSSEKSSHTETLAFIGIFN